MKINIILKSNLIKTTSIYAFTSIVNSIIPFLLLPLLTRYLAPQDYGIVSMFSLLLTIFGVFVGLNVHGAINRIYFEKNINFKEYVFNSIITLVFSTIIVYIIVLIFLKYISNMTSVPKNWILIAILLCFFQFIILSILAIFRSRMLAFNYSFIQIIQSIINIIFTIVFVVLLKFNWKGRVLGQAVSIIITGLICVYILFKNWVKIKFNLNYIKHSLSFGVPLIPQTLGGLLITMTNRFIITNVLGIYSTGIFMAGLQLGSVIGIIADAFNKSFAPWLFSKLDENNESVKKRIIKFTYFYFLILIISSILTGYLLPFFIKFILGKSFVQSSSVVFFICLGGAFHGMYYIVVNYLFYSYKTGVLALITIFCGLLNIPLTYFLTKKYGILGSSYSYSIIFFLIFLLTWIASAKYYKMPWKL